MSSLNICNTSSLSLMINQLSNYHPRLTFLVFILLQMLFAGYVLRGEVPYNFEMAFILFVFVLGYLIFKKTPVFRNRRLWYWSGLNILYLSVVFIISYYHAPLEDAGLKSLQITGLIIGFLVILWTLFLLRPTLDFFWMFFVGASLTMLVWFGLELSHFGLDGLIEGQRFGSRYGHPIKFGIYANGLFIILLGGGIWAYRKGSLMFFVWIFLLITNLLAVVFSQTRTAWIGWPEAIIGWGLFYFLILIRSSLTARLKMTLLALPILFVVAFVSTESVYNVFEKRIALVFTDTQSYVSGEQPLTSVGLRYLMYEAAYELIKERPLMGYGADAFSENLQTVTSRLLKDKFNIKHPGLDFTQIHNQFLMIWLNYGVFALLALLSMFAFLFWHFFTGMRSASMDEKPIWIAGLVFSVASFMSFMPESPLQYSTYSSHFFLIFSLLLGFSMILGKRTGMQFSGVLDSAQVGKS